MQGGDISAGTLNPRHVYTFEGVIATLGPGDDRREAKLIRKRKFDEAVDLWQISEHQTKVMRDTLWRTHLAVDILCTHESREFARALQRRLDDVNYPFCRFMHSSADYLDTTLYLHPEIHTIYHCDINRPFLYGHKGFVLI